MRQPQMSLHVLRLDGKKRLVISPRHIVVTQPHVAVGAEIERSQIAFVQFQHLAIFINRIVILSEIDIGLGLL